MGYLHLLSTSSQEDRETEYISVLRMFCLKRMKMQKIKGWDRGRGRKWSGGMMQQPEY